MATRSTTGRTAASGSGAGGGDYTARHLQVLEGLEAVRKRPGMYIGSTDQRGLMHCLWEIRVRGPVSRVPRRHCRIRTTHDLTQHQPRVDRLERVHKRQSIELPRSADGEKRTRRPHFKNAGT